MAGFGQLVLVVGDLHIPERANAIPESFKRMLVPNKMQHVICTGNVGPEQYAELCNLAPNVTVVRGDYDDCGFGGSGEQSFPEVAVIQVGQFRIGAVHGHQLFPPGSHDARARMRRKLDVDIFVSGHTHQNEVVLEDGYHHINPGSITGAYSAMTPEAIPSFILLSIQDDKLVCYVYELNRKGEVEVSKTEFTKAPPPTNADGTPAGGGNNPALLQSLLA